jgi:tetratricopeptide (TPR) repeat protein
MEEGIARLLAHFREAFVFSPTAAFRDWFRAQEDLNGRGDAQTARALADDLWEQLPALSFDSPEARARFLHNAGVFFGTAGPAAGLARARFCFGQALDHFASHAEDGWRARALHNLATALANLGETAGEVREAVGLFREALAWRTAEREIARGVSLHNLGLALRRLSELEPAEARQHLSESAAALAESAAIRESNRLEEGLAATRRELAETLSKLRGGNPEVTGQTPPGAGKG